jgi:hypothetical protein
LRDAIDKGPVGVLISGLNPIFRFYKKGIINNKNCGDKVNHAVLAIGYGKNLFGEEYFIMKNTWGKGWGEDGFFRIAADKKMFNRGICGLFSFNYIGFVEEISVSDKIIQ